MGPAPARVQGLSSCAGLEACAGNRAAEVRASGPPPRPAPAPPGIGPPDELGPVRSGLEQISLLYSALEGSAKPTSPSSL